MLGIEQIIDVPRANNVYTYNIKKLLDTFLQKPSQQTPQHTQAKHHIILCNEYIHECDAMMKNLILL